MLGPTGAGARRRRRAASRCSPVRGTRRGCVLSSSSSPSHEKTQATVGSHEVEDLPQQQTEGDESQWPGQVHPSVGLGPPVGGNGLDVEVGELARRVIPRAAGAVVVGQPQILGHLLELVGVDLRHPGLPAPAPCAPARGRAGGPLEW